MTSLRLSIQSSHDQSTSTLQQNHEKPSLMSPKITLHRTAAYVLGSSLVALQLFSFILLASPTALEHSRCTTSPTN
ncbi:hypothetical protein BJX99DRAFT_224282 [Aspergillus californicus]